MSKRPWFPLYVADYLGDTPDLTVEQHGVYMLLLMTAWRRPDGALVNDQKWLKAVLPPMHGHTYNRLVPAILERFFVLGADGKWRNGRLEKERQNADKLSAKQKQNADKRWSATSNNNNLSNANAMPSQSQSHSQKREEGLKVVGGKEARGWSPPSQGAISRRRGTIYFRKGTTDGDSYASDYRQAHSGVDPPWDTNGGFWFRIAGEQAG